MTTTDDQLVQTNRRARRTADKPYKGMAMEGPIASWYARNTKGDMRGYRACADAVTRGLLPGARILEVAPGPGYGRSRSLGAETSACTDSTSARRS